MKHKFFLTLLLLLAATTATAHDFEVDGIFYNIINGNEAAVTYKGQYYNQYSNEYSGSVSIPTAVTFDDITYSVTSIGSCAFYDCSRMTSLSIPSSITDIEDSPFHGCIGLSSIMVESGNPNYDSRGNCNAIVETASNMLITGCKNTTIPSSVTSIGNSAFFGCSGLTSVIIPNSVTSIGMSAFYDCSSLTEVTIPNSVNFIGEGAFWNCI